MSGPAYTLGLLGPVAIDNIGGGNIVPPQDGGTGVANDPASTIAISGAFGITLTVSATTALTLPTSGTVTALGNTTIGSGAIVLAAGPTLTGTLNCGPVISTGDITIAAASSFIFLGRTKINTGNDGNLLVQNNSGNDFGRLMLGSNTSLFPALKRSTTKVAFRLADDSADCGITVSTIAASDNITMGTAAKGLVLKQGANGKCGTFVANGITPVSVGNTSIAITDTIIISLNTVGGTVGVQPHVATITAATGFTVVCTATDTSTYNYSIISNQP